MSAVSLQYKANDEPILQRLRALAALGGDLSPITKAIAYHGEQSTRQRFATETAPDGTKWTPSARATEKGGKTLTKSGQLASSQASRGTADKAQWGTNKVYAAIHQFGFDGTVQVKSHTRRIKQVFGRKLSFPVYQTVGSFKRHMTMIARPYLGISAGDEADIQDIVAIKLRAAAERGA